MPIDSVMNEKFHTPMARPIQVDVSVSEARKPCFAGSDAENWFALRHEMCSAQMLRHWRGPAAFLGFTLIELMVTIAILGILMSIGIPSFKSFLDRNRIAGEMNSFVSDVQFARSEAIKRGQAVSVCVSSDGATCVAENNWHKGWVVFSDLDNSGAVNGSDKILRYRKGWSSSDTFTASSSLTVLSFNRDGFATRLPSTGVVTMPLRAKVASSTTTRCVQLNPVGRQVIQTVGTGACT